ncbi:MAG: DUF2147 domain-containing protein [Aestuariivirga sp.]
MKKIAGALALCAIAFLTVGVAKAGNATGTWIMENGKITVNIAPCGGNLCGKIVAMKKPLDRKGNPKRDKHNPDPALRDRPVIGLTILANMKPDGEASWAGKIYNPDDGNTYSSYMKLNEGQMKVKGCVVFICKKLAFRRID